MSCPGWSPEHLISEERPGAIVNVASEAGKIGHAQSIAYSASKAALTRFVTESG